MAITYPLTDFPGFVRTQRFEVDGGDAVSVSGGGRLYGVRRVTPLWTGDFQTTTLQRTRLAMVRTFLRKLRGATGTFLFWDQTRTYPQAYMSFAGMVRGAGAADPGGDFAAEPWAESYTLSLDREDLSLTGLPAGFHLQGSDYVAFAWGEDFIRRSLHAVLSDGVADSDGDGTWTLDPAVPDFVPEDARVDLFKPSCVMRLIPGSFDLLIADGERAPIAFKALQDLRA